MIPDLIYLLHTRVSNSFASQSRKLPSDTLYTPTLHGLVSQLYLGLLTVLLNNGSHNGRSHYQMNRRQVTAPTYPVLIQQLPDMCWWPKGEAVQSGMSSRRYLTGHGKHGKGI